MQINKITIIGGGSSGWMTAAALSELCDHLDITLVESPTFATVGVGESITTTSPSVLPKKPTAMARSKSIRMINIQIKPGPLIGLIFSLLTANWISGPPILKF